MAEKKIGFEEKLKRLEEITEQLEDGKCTLEMATELFDEGIKLSEECDKMLDTAARRITEISPDQENE